MTTRRDFLKGLASLAGAAVVSTLPKPARADESIWYDAIPDIVLDMPVTSKEPLAWLELDGHKVAILKSTIDVHQDFIECMEFGGAWDSYARVPGLTQWRMDCTLQTPEDDARLVMDKFYSGKRHDIRLLPVGDSRIYSGQAYFSDFVIDATTNRNKDFGELSVRAAMVGTGEFSIEPV